MSNISWKPRAGVEFVDGGLRIDMDKFAPGMEPFIVERHDGVAHVSDIGIRIETHNGDIHWHRRDGQQESLLRRIRSVNIAADLHITGTEQVQLNHGSRLSWYLEPSGSIHITFDAHGKVDEVSTFGVETMTSPDGDLTVLAVLANGYPNNLFVTESSLLHSRLSFQKRPFSQASIGSKFPGQVSA